MTSAANRTCYVIMPFSKIGGISASKWTETYEHVFKPAIEGAGLGYTCERSRIRNGQFVKDIIQNLKNSRVVLADITSFNPNVMWELGIRHTLSQRTILVTRTRKNSKLINSDMSSYGVIEYSMTPSGIDAFKRRIKELLEGIEKDPDRSDNPVFEVLKAEELVLSS